MDSTKKQQVWVERGRIKFSLDNEDLQKLVFGTINLSKYMGSVHMLGTDTALSSA
jgi:hypothetical protein